LADAGLKELFLDRWNLVIGTRWRPMLEKALGSSKAVAVLRLYSSHITIVCIVARASAEIHQPIWAALAWRCILAFRILLKFQF
jgi:hypothetical protein